MSASQHDTQPAAAADERLPVSPGISGDWVVNLDEAARVRGQLAERAIRLAPSHDATQGAGDGLASIEETIRLGERLSFRAGQDYN